MSNNLDACPKLKELGVADNAAHAGREVCLECEYPECFHALPFGERCRIGHRLARRQKRQMLLLIKEPLASQIGIQRQEVPK